MLNSAISRMVGVSRPTGLKWRNCYNEHLASAAFLHWPGQPALTASRTFHCDDRWASRAPTRRDAALPAAPGVPNQRPRPGIWDCQIFGVTDLGHQLVVVGSIRPSKVTANAFNAGFQRMTHRALPRPVGSSDRVAR